MAAGEWPEAERHFADALAAAERMREESEYEISPWLIHFLRGAAVARQSRLDEARAAFEAALALRPDHADSLWLLALTHAEARHWAGCWSALERLGALGRDDFPYHTECAIALTGLGRHDEAAAAAARALEQDATSVPVLGLRAEALYRGKRFEEAAEAYEALLALDPGAIPARLVQAQCYEVLGDREAMMAAYAAAVELAPESPDVLFALGSACLRGDALEAARECLSGAVERAPGRADYRLNHALCLIKLGALDEAQAAVREMSRTWPQVAEIRQLQDLLDRLAPHQAAARERG
jgi:tetratricopeptide (TPR) repeat protein